MYSNIMTISIVVPLIIGVVIALLIWNKITKTAEKVNKNDKLYVNYHLTRQCNYKCGFCFHTAKTSYVLSLDEAKTGIYLLAQYGMILSSCTFIFLLTQHLK